MARSISAAAGELSSACTGSSDQHGADGVADEPRRDAAQEPPGRAGTARGFPRRSRPPRGARPRLRGAPRRPGAERRRHLDPGRDVVGGVGERRPGLLAELPLRLGRQRGHDGRHRFDEAGVDHAGELDSGSGRGENCGLASTPQTIVQGRPRSRSPVRESGEARSCRERTATAPARHRGNTRIEPWVSTQRRGGVEIALHPAASAVRSGQRPSGASGRSSLNIRTGGSGVSGSASNGDAFDWRQRMNTYTGTPAIRSRNPCAMYSSPAP